PWPHSSNSVPTPDPRLLPAPNPLDQQSHPLLRSELSAMLSLSASAHRTASPPVLICHEAQSLQRRCGLPLRPTQFPVYAYVMSFTSLLFHNTNTWYGRLTIPYPTGTLTLQEAPSFAWRTQSEKSS